MDTGERHPSLHKLMEAVATVGYDLELAGMLRRLIASATDLVGARFGALGVLDEAKTRLAQFITVGIDEDGRKQIGELPQGHGILGTLIVDAQPLRLPDLNAHPDSFGFPPGHPPMTSFLGVPIRVRDEVFGNLYLTDKLDGDQFTDLDEELIIALATAAGVAIENARLHHKVNEMSLVEDRERIARDLHDTVIQRLFATGMALQGSIRMVRSDPDAVVERIEAAVDDLDVTVKHIRAAIFGLEASKLHREGTRARILNLVHQGIDALGFEPRILLEGPVDTGMSEAHANELVATLREAISNVARHAQASQVDVHVVVEDDVRLIVTDDGIGPPAPDGRKGHGLKNMAARAEKLGGTLALTEAEGGGTRLEWCVPRY